MPQKMTFSTALLLSLILGPILLLADSHAQQSTTARKIFAKPKVLWTYPSAGQYAITNVLNIEDIDSDGTKDLVVVHPSHFNQKLKAISGKKGPAVPPLWVYPLDVSFAELHDDLNGDLNRDIVFTTSTGFINVYLGIIDSKTGNLLKTATIPSNQFAFHLKSISDVNSDGIRDIVIATGTSDHRIYTIDGSTLNVLSTFNTFSLPKNPAQISGIEELGDVNNDQITDIAFSTADSSNKGYVGVISALGGLHWSVDGGFGGHYLKAISASTGFGKDIINVPTFFESTSTKEPLYRLDGTSGNIQWSKVGNCDVFSETVVTSNITGDLNEDVITLQSTHYDPSCGGSNEISLKLFNGISGIKDWEISAALGTGISQLVDVGDVNGDAKADIAAMRWYDGKVHLLNGKTGEQIAQYSVAKSWNAIKVNNIGSDGKPDFLVLGQGVIVAIGN